MPRNKKKAATKRASAARKNTAKEKDNSKAKPTNLKKTKVPVQPELQAAGSNRAEGIRLFKLAERPTKEEFVLVYGEAGPRMTWEQRAKAGIPAEKFQAALAAKQRGD
jgi:hypothetical protein